MSPRAPFALGGPLSPIAPFALGRPLSPNAPFAAGGLRGARAPSYWKWALAAQHSSNSALGPLYKLANYTIVSK